MAIRISGPYKGFFITVEATPAIDWRVAHTHREYDAAAYIYRRAPSGDGRGVRLDANPGRRFSCLADAFVFGETWAHKEIDHLHAQGGTGPGPSSTTQN